MNALNRFALVIVPKQHFVDWVNGLNTGAPPLTLEEVQRDSAIYLIPKLADDAAVKEYLRTSVDQIFADQLSSWWTEPADWPQDRTLATFEEWFAYRTYSMVLDLVSGRLVRAKVEVAR